jgi:hypothetical protein
MKKNIRHVTGWTDYPIEALGDKPCEKAPIRRVEVIAYDGDKYITVEVIGQPGVQQQMKRGYLYSRPGRSEIKTLNGVQMILHPKVVSGDKISHAFGYDSVARYYAKQGIRIKRDRRGGFTFLN